MTNGWKSIQKISPDYLTGRGSYTIIETDLTSRDSDEFKKIFEWCEKNSDDCWSVAQLDSHGENITWRFYDSKVAQKFKKKFKKHIIEKS